MAVRWIGIGILGVTTFMAPALAKPPLWGPPVTTEPQATADDLGGPITPSQPVIPEAEVSPEVTPLSGERDGTAAAARAAVSQRPPAPFVNEYRQSGGVKILRFKVD